MSELLPVTPPCGPLLGVRRRGVGVFKGIPYAEPPVNALRWRPPVRLGRWGQVRHALAAGPAPLQELPSRASLIYRLNNDDGGALVMSEDCLYLNVWTPDPSREARLPVFVWVHGGSNRTGHGDQSLFDGTALARRGMVVVTINMRLGALGFLSLPELADEDPLGASGNYGALDVVAALEWVRDNIAWFGGDPSRVTLAGNSAGAATVSHLMASPLARGLFGGAIGQSLGGLFRHEGRMLTQHEAAARGQAMVASLGTSLRELRDQPATSFLRMPPQGIVVDGRLLVDDTTKVYLQGKQARIPLLTGWNADEGSLFATADAAADLKPIVDAHVDREALERIYPSAFENPQVRRALIGDRRFAYPVWRWARTHVETSGSPTWLYAFDHPLPLPADIPAAPDVQDGYGVFHTAELPYVFDNLDVRPWAWTATDRSIAGELADTWARFVIHGDPNGGKTPVWKPFNPLDEVHLMTFGSTIKPDGAKRREAFDLFDRAYFGPTPPPEQTA